MSFLQYLWCTEHLQHAGGTEGHYRLESLPGGRLNQPWSREHFGTALFVSPLFYLPPGSSSGLCCCQSPVRGSQGIAHIWGIVSLALSPFSSLICRRGATGCSQCLVTGFRLKLIATVSQQWQAVQNPDKEQQQHAARTTLYRCQWGSFVDVWVSHI